MKSESQPYRWSVEDSKGLPRHLGAFVRAWQESACVLMRENWNGLLSEPVELEFIGTDVNTCRKLLGQFPENGYGAQYSLGPQNAAALLACPASLVRRLIADLLGVDAVKSDGSEQDELTPIELSMVELFFGEVARAWSQSWPQLKSLDCHLDRIITRPHRSRLFGQEEELVRTRFEIKMGDRKEAITWIARLQSVQEIVGEAPDPDPQVNSQVEGHLENAVENIQLNLVVELGKAEVSLRELEQLAPGDVIVLDQSVNSPLRGMVGGRTTYLGFACRVGGRSGFRVHLLPQR